MVNVGNKEATKRTARARAVMFLGEDIISQFTNDDMNMKKVYFPGRPVVVHYLWVRKQA